MIQIKVKGLDDIRKKLRRLSSGQLDKAIARGITDTMRKAQTTGRQEVRKATGERAKEVNKAIRARGANARRLVAEVISRSYTPNLIKLTPRKENQFHRARKKAKYKGRGSSSAQYRRGGVTAKSYGKAKQYPNTWVHEMGNNSAIVLHRTGGKRTSPIELAYGPDINRAFASPKVQALIQRRIDTNLSKDIDRSIGRALKQAGL